MKVGVRPDQQPVPGGMSTGTAAGGDVSGPLPGGLTVVGIGGVPITGAPSVTGQTIVYNVTTNQFEYTTVTSLLPGAVGELLIADVHSTPLVFDDILQNDDGDNFLYNDVG